MNIIKSLSLSLLCISSGFLYAADHSAPLIPPPAYNPDHAWDAPPPPQFGNPPADALYPKLPSRLIPEAPPPPFESPSAPPAPVAGDEDILTGMLARIELQKANVAALDSQLAALKKQYEEVQQQSSGNSQNAEVALAQITKIQKTLDDIHAKLSVEYAATQAECKQAHENNSALERRYRDLYAENSWCRNEIKKINNKIIDLSLRFGRAVGDKNHYSDTLKSARQETERFRSMQRADKKAWADTELRKENRNLSEITSKIKAEYTNLLKRQQKEKIAQFEAQALQQKLTAIREAQEKNARDKGIKERSFALPTPAITELYTLFSSQVRYPTDSQEYTNHVAKIDAAFVKCATKGKKLELCQSLYHYSAHNESNPQVALAVSLYAQELQKTHYWWLGGSGVVGLAAFFTAAFAFPQ